ncbi:MAG TPA: hypothetical protein VGE01_13455 [Fimbriimonas sp.]
MMRRLAFTLIELLTVIAITAVLLTLIIVPVFQSFNLTRTAQAFAEAQERARTVSERIAREIGNSAGVRDLSGIETWPINGVNTSVARHTLAVTVPSVTANGTPNDGGPIVQVALPYSKIDMYLPAEGEETIDGTGNGYRNPVTGKIDPTLRAPRGAVRLPAAPGQLWVRYFIGLREPVRVVNGQLAANPYRDPYTGLLQTRGSERDNLYVIWRVEYAPRQAGAWNASLFALDANGRPMDLDNPAFFSLVPGVDTASGTDLTLTAEGTRKAQRILHWMGQSAPGESVSVRSLGNATIVTEVSRYDMIQPLYDLRSRQVKNTNGVPNVLSLLQFRPTRVDNDNATPQTAVRLGEETQNAGTLAADVYTTRFGMWSNAVVRIWPGSYSPNGANEYLVGRPTPNGFSIFAIDPDNAANDEEMREGVELFDMAAYESAPKYPFSAAVISANSRSGWTSDARLRELFVPFFTNPGRGRVIASFGISEVGDIANAASTGSNLPYVRSGIPSPPGDDPASAAPFSPYPDRDAFTINQVFNRVWNQYPELQGTVERFIDTRVVANADGVYSPLFPNFIGGATGFTTANPTNQTRASRVAIVPGSDEVFGPDQLSGPNYGNRIRYTRVNGRPGPNQYRINLTDLPEPTNDAGQVDYQVAFPGVAGVPPVPPSTYDPNSLISAVLQPRFRAGYIQLNSDPNTPLPDGPFEISYRFQFVGGRKGNQPGDRLAVDYDTRQLISVLLTIRNYPQSSAPNPQSVTLKATATVRNYVR